MKSFTTTPLLTKTALFAAVFAVVSVTAGTLAYAQSNNTNSATKQQANSYMGDQCKDGGWEALGYKNQGQCVSNFARD